MVEDNTPQVEVISVGVNFTENIVRDNDIEEIERLLLEAEENEEDIAALINRPLAQWNQTPLHIAATEGHFDLVCLFLQNGADIDTQDKNNWSPLHCAAKHSHLDVTEVLLKQRANINILNESGTSAFHYLVRFKVHPKQKDTYKTVLDSMKDLGQNIDVENENGETPLHQACLEGCVVAIQWLLLQKSQIDKTTRYGETPLHFACRSGQKEAVLMLLEAGADLEVEGAYGTPRKVAENTTFIVEAIDEFAAQKLQKYDDSSDEESGEFVSLVNAIPEDLRLSISPGAYLNNLSTPSMSYRRIRKGKKPIIFNGPTNMASEQRRIRHVQAIHFRNLPASDHKLLHCYFTIHPYAGNSSNVTLPAGDILYQSSIEMNSLNPSWNLHFTTTQSDEFLRIARFTLKLWECSSAPHRCILETNVRLYRFGFLGEDLGRVNVPVENLLILELLDGLYVKEDVALAHPMNSYSQDLTPPVACPSYTRTQFHNILKLKQKIYKARERTHQLKHNLQGKLAKQRQLLEKKQKHDLLVQSVLQLKADIVTEKSRKKERDDLLQELKDLIVPQTKTISQALVDILSTKQDLQISVRGLNDSKTQLSEFLWALEARQSSLIRDLRTIFPITQTADQHKSLCVNNIRLPNTDFTGCSEEGIATALGLVCQILFMLSLWLDVPLRYQMTPALSRSIICDRISNVYPSTSSFPLYSRGVDRTRFEYAVYLLNKNLEQLLNSQNLDIITLRHTLPNLQLLLISRGKGARGRSGRRRAASSTASSSTVQHSD